MYSQFLNSNSSPILELSQICHEDINQPLDSAYLADFGIDINQGIRNILQLTTRFSNLC